MDGCLGLNIGVYCILQKLRSPAINGNMLEKQIKTLFSLNGLCLLIANVIALLRDIHAV